MLLNLLTFSLFVGFAATSYGNGNSNTFADEPHPASYRSHRRHRSSSSSNEEKWDCARLGVFNLTNATAAALTSAPKIAYFAHQGKEKAVVVCQNTQVETLLGKSRDANVPAGITNDYKDVGVLSFGTRSGLTFTCNKRDRRYEAVNLITRQTIPIDAVACLTVSPSEVVSTVAYFGQLSA